METRWWKLMGCSKSSSEKEVYSKTTLPQATRDISNKQAKLTRKATRERRTSKTQRNHKDQSRNKRNREEENNSKYQWN